jgi:uncharacterized protein YecT (DUF1311 family)
MRQIRLITPLMLLSTLWASTALGVQDERTLREECSAYSQAGMRDCLAQKVVASQQALQQAESETLSLLSKWDEDAKHASQAKVQLAHSGTAFAKYREAQCAYMASLRGGAIGNAAEVTRLACVAELNHRRAEQLRKAAAGLPLR